MSNCVICGKDFPYKPNIANGPKKYCSIKCKYDGMRGENNYRWGKVLKKCIVCGNDYKVKKSVAIKGKTKFCSPKCSGVWKSEHCKADKSKMWTSVKALCQYCGVAFYRKKYQYDRAQKSFCSKLCRNKYFVGEHTWRWNGGITSELRKIRGDNRMFAWARAVKKRDSYACRKCGVRDSRINAHHIVRFQVILSEATHMFPSLSMAEAVDRHKKMWDISNGITLCEKCHKIEHKQERICKYGK